MKNWTPISKATPDVSSYDHTTLETPIGEFIIEWKAWKENPSYDIIIEDHGCIGTEYSLEDAKKKVHEYLTERSQRLTEFLANA